MISSSPQKVVVSSEIPDWTREKPSRFWDPGKKLILAIRKYQKCRKIPGLLGKLLAAPYVHFHRFWSIVSGADIPLNCRLEGGLLLPHPTGVVIHPDAEIGINCTIFQQVTIVSGVKIGGHVDIGAGAKIIRSISIGSNVRIGANAVVLEDIPSNSTAVGIPAQIVGSRSS